MISRIASILARMYSAARRNSTERTQDDLYSQPLGETLEGRRLLTAVPLTDHDQLLLELVNRARTDPAGELARFEEIDDLNFGLAPGTISSEPKQPLAPHQALVDIAVTHSESMLLYDYFSHTNHLGEDPAQRAADAGYQGQVSENIAWGGTTGPLHHDEQVERRHKSVFLSAPHRQNLLAENVQEFGTGVRFGVYTTQPPVTSVPVDWNAVMITEVFGSRSASQYITGVVYRDDVVIDDFYSVGESEPGVQITAVNIGTGDTFSTVTGSSGGYGIQVPDGVYTVTAAGGSLQLPRVVSDVVVDSRNVKVDFDTAEPAEVAELQIVARDDQGRWWVNPDTATKHHGSWSPTIDWQDVTTLDMNGDGLTDIVGRADRDWWVALATGKSHFVIRHVASWDAGTWSDVQAGDFNGDGLDDLAGRSEDGGWWISLSDGNRLRAERWGGWVTKFDWFDIMVADPNGDGLDDIVGRAADGTWWVAESQGDRFFNKYWATWSTNVDWLDVQVGDVNGDGLDDIVGRVAQDGTWWVGRSVGNRFATEHWGGWVTKFAWHDVAIADVNGDGRDDILGRAHGTWWAAQSLGDRFVNVFWGRWDVDKVWEDVLVVDADRDGDDDVIGRSDGLWTIAEARDDQFVNRTLDSPWPTDTDWRDVAVGEFM